MSFLSLLAENDGLVNNHWDEADIMFLVAAILGALAAIAYAAGVGTINKPETAPEHANDATTKTPTGPVMAGTPVSPYRSPRWTRTTWHYRAHEVAAALLSIAVACVAFGLFLQ